MFTQILSGFVATVMIASVAVAAPAAKGKTTFDTYVSEVSKETGKPEKEVREKAIEALRSEGKYSKAELERIGREKIDLDPVKQKEMVSLLKVSRTFRATVGLAAVKNEKVNAEMKEEFGKMKNEEAFVPGKAEVKADVKAPKAEKTELSRMDKEALALAHVSKNITKTAFESVMKLAAENSPHYEQVRKFSTKIATRVKEGKMDRAKAEQLVIDVANSPKQLGAELVVIGETAGEACAKMARDAVENYADFIRGGAIVGKDPATYLEGMGEAAAKKFKQELEEGIARVCALVNSSCGLFNAKAFAGACKARAGAAFAM